MTVSGMFDGGTDEAPPHLEPGLAFGIQWCAQEWITEQHGVERIHDLAAMCFGPSDRIVVLEAAVFGIGAIDFEANDQRAGGSRPSVRCCYR